MTPREEEPTGAAMENEATELADLELQDETADEQEKPPLSLEIAISSPSACQRHVTVTIAEEDVRRYMDEAFSELMPNAQVPGFRPGRAPRKLVESRFRKEVSQQVKGNLMLDSIRQVSEEQQLAAISEPDFDLDAIEIPDTGPMTFEFDLEVRPDFDMPQWKGLKVERPVYEVSKDDVERRMSGILRRLGHLVPHDEAAAADDYLVCNIVSRHDGRVLSRAEETLVRLRRSLSFRDARIDEFADQMVGVKAGQMRQITVTVTQTSPNESLRGQQVTLDFDVLEVKRIEVPELTPDLLLEIGDFESEGDLRDAIQQDLERQLRFRQMQVARQQIASLLTQQAEWDLPPELLQRQSRRELERSVLEMRRNGFTDEEIRAHANELRHNALDTTARALKEHFILERIAEDEQIDADESDYDAEIRLIALQSGETPRRVRARLEKQDLMDVLRNQIVERKVIERVIEHAQFQEVPWKPEDRDVEALDHAVSGGTRAAEIPTATHGEAQPLKAPEERT